MSLAHTGPMVFTVCVRTDNLCDKFTFRCLQKHFVYQIINTVQSNWEEHHCKFTQNTPPTNIFSLFLLKKCRTAMESVLFEAEQKVLKSIKVKS